MHRIWNRRSASLVSLVSLVTACAVFAHDASAQRGGGATRAVPLAGVGTAPPPAVGGGTTSAPPANGGATTGTAPQAGAAGGGTAAAGGKAVGDTSALPQFESGVEFEPRSPNYKVSFSLEDADLNELVRVIGQLTGKRFIFGGKVRNIKASIYSPQKVTVAEAYQAFLSILETNGLTVVPHGRFLKIVETAGIASQDTPTYGSGQAAPAEDRFVTRLHRLQHASAEEVANILGHFKSKDGDITVHSGGNLLIITDTGSNIRRMMQIIEEIDVGSSGDQMWIEGLHYAAASDVASRINEIFDLKGGATAKPGDKAGGGGGAGVSLGDAHVTKVMAEDRSNSVIIVATERAYLRILEFIKRIDIPNTSGEGEIHVLPLQHADALELVKTLNDIVSGAAGAGQPGAAGKAAASAVPSGIFEGGIKVSADKATNSIVVTSSLRDYASLRAVVNRIAQARRQVFIEAVIMDLSVNRTDTLGISYHGGIADALFGGSGNSLIYGGLNPLSSALTPNPNDLQGLALGVRGPNIPGSGAALGTGVDIPAFGVVLSALSQTGDVDVLSTPHILATDNENAIISVGENVPLQQNVQSLPSGAGGAGFNPFAVGGVSPQRQDVGTKIDITPHLNTSNEVRLDLIETISEAGAAQGSLGVVPITQRSASTKLVVQDQQTVVIGGLMRNSISHTEDKIPVLGDIPILGALFRKSVNRMRKTNLILILTPYIIREQNDLRVIFERKMQERQEFLDRYFVFSDEFDYKPPKDYSRTNGLLEEIKETYRLDEEKLRLDEIMRPKEIKTHSPGEPLDLPVRPAGPGGTIASPPPGGATPAPPPNVNVAPAVRATGVDRLEK
ncbi:hypothetical protein BH09MYX1_BH09MYX1_22830 [soil metagenome]